ncbi:MAG: hypothetical protein ACLPPF_04710 [Rhodomicrobium sp.]
MKAETFSRLLDQHVEEAWEQRLCEPKFKISSNVAFTMVELCAQKAPNLSRMPPFYSEMLEETQVLAQYSLSGLAAQISKATTVEELRYLRREFAQQCHPDHHGKEGKCAATSVMAAANRLIDDAILAFRGACPAKL